MARPVKRGKTWRVEVCAGGIRDSATFAHRATAEQWAATRRAELLAASRGQIVAGKTLADALQRFAAELCPGRRGGHFEQTRITAWCKPAAASPAAMPFVGLPLDRITSDAIGDWRDARLRIVSAGSVLRDLGLLSAVIEAARREWKWCAINPVRDVRKPPAPRGRSVRVSDADLERVRAQLGDDVRTVSGRIYWAARFAVATGMRVGEICALAWPDVSDKVARVAGTAPGAGKTDRARRDVPLSTDARAILAQLRGVSAGAVFALRKASVDTLWRRSARAAGLAGVHFHDLRHEAISRLAGKIEVMALARMVGHADPKMLLRYYHPCAEDLADRLG